MSFHVTELMRVTTGKLASSASDGNNGYFDMESPENGWRLAIVASDGGGFEHVSVHAYQGKKQRVPRWREMCYVKDLFWDDEDAVMQLHPPKKDYINEHPCVLHLWRPTKEKIPLPKAWMVGRRPGQTYEEVLAESEKDLAEEGA